MRDVYGYSDIEANETVSVEVITKEEVAYVKGKAESGGSRNNWVSIVPENSKIILQNVNKNIYDKYMQNPDKQYEI